MISDDNNYSVENTVSSDTLSVESQKGAINIHQKGSIAIDIVQQ